MEPIPATPAAGPKTPSGFIEWAKTSGRKYLIVFAWLVGLTVLEVATTFLGLPKRTLATILIATALLKATLVALYFMHLRHEARLILGVGVFPLLLALVFVLLLFPDIVFGVKT